MYHALHSLLSVLEYCGQRCITRGGAAGQAFEEFSEADAFYRLHQTTQLSKVVWQRREAWGAFSKILREILQR